VFTKNSYVQLHDLSSDCTLIEMSHFGELCELMEQSGCDLPVKVVLYTIIARSI